jgi:hypothetical protein
MPWPVVFARTGSPLERKFGRREGSGPRPIYPEGRGAMILAFGVGLVAAMFLGFVFHAAH